MPLENLLDTVETLRRRITEHGAALRQSEALTRYALIDPLLRVLGWNTEDPSMVIPEYRSSAGSADYALLGNDSSAPALIIEAKKLGEPLDDKVTLQGLNYCNFIGTPHFALTDGKTWKIYLTFKQAPLEERLISTFTVGEMSPAKVCLQALALWRPSVQGSSIIAAQEPIIGLGAVQNYVTTDATDNSSMANAVSEPTETYAPTPVQERVIPPSIEQKPINQSLSPDITEWIPLSELKPPKYSKPAELLFPDNSSIQITSWAAMMSETVRWLLNKNLLVESHCPIKQGRTRYIIASKPFHSDGAEFKRPRQVGPVYIEIYYSGQIQVRNTKTIIEHTGQLPAHFKVRLASLT